MTRTRPNRPKPLASYADNDYTWLCSKEARKSGMSLVILQVFGFVFVGLVASALAVKLLLSW